jgi:hypothetical protein
MLYSSLKMSLTLIVSVTIRSSSCFHKRGCNRRVMTLLLSHLVRVIYRFQNFYSRLCTMYLTCRQCSHDLIYSCCSHLEHSASVKRSVSVPFLNLRHSVGLLGQVISSSQDRYLTQTQNKHKQTSMPRMGFEPTIPAFE